MIQFMNHISSQEDSIMFFIKKNFPKLKQTLKLSLHKQGTKKRLCLVVSSKVYQNCLKITTC